MKKILAMVGLMIVGLIVMTGPASAADYPPRTPTPSVTGVTPNEPVLTQNAPLPKTGGVDLTLLWYGLGLIGIGVGVVAVSRRG